MIYKVFSVHDKAVQAFLPPFFCRSKGEAIRSFSEAANDPQRFARHAVDYDLVELGEFDDNSGLFSGSGPNRVIGAVECLADRDDGVSQGEARRSPRAVM